MTGAGIKVGVIDTGIDYDHLDLGGNGAQQSNSQSFPTARVVAGWDFVGDAFNNDTDTTPVPDPYPDDCNGHGTHVAGIVGANGAVKGVAPNVTFGAYRVFGCEGRTTNDLILAAMERALADGMHVVNMSLGSGFQWHRYPTAQAATRLVNKGVVVVAAIGNDGEDGLYSAGAPGVGQKVIGVASYENSHFTLPTFTVTPGQLTVGYREVTGSPHAPSSGSLPLTRSGTASSTNDACSALTGQFGGSAVLIRRGGCPFNAKAANAQAAGAAAVVLYNNAPGFISATVEGATAITIPVVEVQGSDGIAIDAALDAAPQTLNWQSAIGTFPNPFGGLISDFSAYGLSPDLALKPDVGAPGGSIRSTYPLELGGYAVLSGTSMSSPHVAGGVALLLEAKPRTPSQAVRAILQNSADPRPWRVNPASGLLENVHRQGAGMLDIDDSIRATVRIEPGAIATGEGEAGPFLQTLEVRNSGVSAVTFDLSFVNAQSTDGVTTPSFVPGTASVAFSAPSVTVPGGGAVTVDATITPATGPIGRQYGGYIVLTPRSGGQVYRVPYAGIAGDYQAIQVLTPTSLGLPWLAKTRDGEFFTNNAAGAPYTMNGLDIPFLAIHLDHQARRLRIEAFDADSGQAWHRVSDDQYLSRNAQPAFFFTFPWDGRTTSGKKTYTVPNGRYVLKVSVLKALGDSNNPAHWETWTSPVVTIARP